MKKKLSLPARAVFIITGILATLWFLIRVIPKPSRAAYPCMRMTAPLMSGFVLYLIGMGGIAALIKKARGQFGLARYGRTGMIMLGFGVLLLLIMGQFASSSQASNVENMGPADGPNEPMGVAQGLHPGRVVWVWDPEATNENCINVFELPKPENTNQGVVNRMVVDGIRTLAGKASLAESWDALFRAFNRRKRGQDLAYKPGEKIFIKVNQGTALTTLRNIDESHGFTVPQRLINSKGAREGRYGATETFPSVALEILRELVYVVGVAEEDIAIGDPIGHIYDYNYEAWSTEFPKVVYVDKSFPIHGRTQIFPTEQDLLFYSDGSQSDKLFDVIENADYLINLANFKPHSTAGVSFTAKNHFGSHARRKASHLHYSLIAPFAVGKPTNGGYGKYRAQVDMMGSKFLGRNTLLYLVDGLYGGGSHETRVPVKYFMPPFNQDWSSSIFLSQDQVALESVCYDFLRTEWNGTYAHHPANNRYETMANTRGVDDYLHQAAHFTNWPEGIQYDPDHSGTPMASLGSHEHWNNAAKKQYSRNLGKGTGIELLAIPDSLVGGNGPAISTPDMWLSQGEAENVDPGAPLSASDAAGTRASERLESNTLVTLPFGDAVKAKSFYAVVVDHDNNKWFLCEEGLACLRDEEWFLHTENRSIPGDSLRTIAYDSSEYGMELWLASRRGATVASIPVDARSGATTYYPGNSEMMSENVQSLTVGKGSLRWIGSDKGVSAFLGSRWLKVNYQRKYPEFMFEDFPITDLATSPTGDTLYIGTRGAGVSRVYRDEVDAISGASEYAEWGPIKMPSDHVTCLYVEADGTQWIGTDKGVARHRGHDGMENWFVLDQSTGLINNHVQCIAKDQQERIWIGTRAGISVFAKDTVSSFGREQGLLGENVQCMAVDRDGIIWIGTDRGVTSYYQGDVIRYYNR